MAEKKRFLDVWIVESNTVYREVPYAVVVDWVQQGRLLDGDNLRWSGQKDWFRLGGTPAFAAYLPHSDPHRAEDQSEALEPVELDFTWKRRRDDEDDDVDMIPLIDVSLVLLIFFIMTTTSVTAALSMNLPKAASAYATSNPEILWIGIDKDKDGNPVYSLGQGDSAPAGEDNNLKTQQELLQRFDARVAGEAGKVHVNVKADENLPAGVVRDMTVELERRRAIVEKKYTGVTDKVQP